jgi:hypothetical protein
LCGALVREGRTVFLRPDDLTRPAPRQWELLRQVERITEARLDEIIAVNDLGERYVPERVVVAPDGEPPRTFGLPACAQRMLAEGVQQDQRVSCFRLAVALKRTGLPFDSALDVLHAWAGRNRPVDGKTYHHAPGNRSPDARRLPGALSQLRLRGSGAAPLLRSRLSGARIQQRRARPACRAERDRVP